MKNDMTHSLNRSELRAIFARHGIAPSHSLGQNFLVDGNVLRKIAGLLELEPSDTVCEVGPGLGALTRELSARAGRVVAVEKDARLAPALREVLGGAVAGTGGADAVGAPADAESADGATASGGCANTEIVTADFLEYDLDTLPRGYKLAGNLPYYITTPIIMKAAEADNMPSRMVFMMQREVAERICAPPGGKDYGAVSVAVQYRCRAHYAMDVSAEVFMPKPRVDSAVIVIEPAHGHRGLAENEDVFRKTVRAGFGQRRKMLRNALSALVPDAGALGAAFARAGVEGTARAEALSVEQFIALSDEINGII
ncbi:MAG: 16S rRNA (adenine(1518)-N(6)/adenine(1519)-N(6))-dimethyltransferase RsmA [Clostridiales Family XIII bacterium]|jgi:16S rRNA (adenine1518-N6/adenine1519-N6)-dimethyltransferase|nr:16S rRNA (adenine(1518)-N(6)/adenine(1519)-N(6))-dimethyltransferase RsmA [Clostridiales Family XIII bacterium]